MRIAKVAFQIHITDLHAFLKDGVTDRKKGEAKTRKRKLKTSKEKSDGR
jgi:hypothetical protein